MNVAPFGDAFLEGLMDGIGAWNVTGWDVWNSKIVENWFGRDLVIDNWELGDVFNNTHLNMSTFSGPYQLMYLFRNRHSIASLIQ